MRRGSSEAVGRLRVIRRRSYGAASNYRSIVPVRRSAGGFRCPRSAATRLVTLQRAQRSFSSLSDAHGRCSARTTRSPQASGLVQPRSPSRLTRRIVAPRPCSCGRDGPAGRARVMSMIRRTSFAASLRSPGSPRHTGGVGTDDEIRFYEGDHGNSRLMSSRVEMRRVAGPVGVE
jgi:hypothetical protein